VYNWDGDAISDTLASDASIQNGAAPRVPGAFDSYTDEDLALLAQRDDEPALEYLLGKYKNYVRSKARSYFLIGASHEDIVQEGMIGLFKAVRDYRPDKLSTFRAFAELCVTRQIITAIKTATRQKHIPLNSYISLNKPVFDEESDRTLLDLITEVRVTNPEDLVIGREEFSKMEGQIGTMLSRLEQEVLLAYLDGHSYQQIAQDLSRHVKSIDNALQRVKRKMEKLLEEKMQAAQ
jgi:RNA polymerase sporulation-specific sigma factor